MAASEILDEHLQMLQEVLANLEIVELKVDLDEAVQQPPLLQHNKANVSIKENGEMTKWTSENIVGKQSQSNYHGRNGIRTPSAAKCVGLIKEHLKDKMHLSTTAEGKWQSTRFPLTHVREQFQQVSSDICFYH